MRVGTTIAAVLLVGTLASSPAEPGPPASGPERSLASVAERTQPGGGRPLPGAPGAPATWTADLAAGEGAGVEMVGGAVRLDPAGVFLAPLEDAGGTGAAATGSTGADAALAGPEGAPDPAAGTPVPTGLLTLPVQRLGGPTRHVDSAVTGAVPAGSTATVDVRGRTADGAWTEWIPSGGGSGTSVTLPRAAVAVQGRLVLTGPPGQLSAAGPAVRGVTLTAYPATLPHPAGVDATTPAASPTTPPKATPSSRPAASPTTSPTTTPTTTSKSAATPTTTPRVSTPEPTDTTPAAAPRTNGSVLEYRVFATREGLVGRTTANGHKIKDSDRFVALPSRRALSPRGSGDYSVKVCAGNGRCAVAPVWDVGPWNTRDDYWNPAERRQEWKDLPQGMPAAQAAKQRGYNDGKDQFGRTVANPAGIDLSDGLFWGALGLKDNSWVTVEYLWTGAGKEDATAAG